jgi:antitoxin HicB
MSKKFAKFEDYEFEIRRIKAEDGGGYTITFPDLPGCRSDGETPSEAESNGREAFDAWLEACIAEGREVPKPGQRGGSPSKFLQRVPRYVHAELLEQSGRQGVSVNSLVMGFIVAGLERINASGVRPSIASGVPSALEPVVLMQSVLGATVESAITKGVGSVTRSEARPLRRSIN